MSKPELPAAFGLDIFVGPAVGSCVGCDRELTPPAVVAIRRVVGGFVLVCIECAMEDLRTRAAHAKGS
jgi:hypothetical protein